jgi:hypothetical protein
MKIKIPRLGTKLIVKKQVTVVVRAESRNTKFLGLKDEIYVCSVCKQEHSRSGVGSACSCSKGDCLQPYHYRYFGRWCVCPKSELKPCDTVIPAGAELTVDRIYIRKNNSEMDSITFQYMHNGKKGRFWLHLDEAEKIDFK